MRRGREVRVARLEHEIARMKLSPSTLVSRAFQVVGNGARSFRGDETYPLSLSCKNSESTDVAIFNVHETSRETPLKLA